MGRMTAEQLEALTILEWDFPKFRRDVMEAQDSRRFGSLEEFYDTMYACRTTNLRLRRGVPVYNLPAILKYVTWYDLELANYIRQSNF